jgi:hypothetical protein
MIIGFTGTREGMTPEQRKTLLLCLQMAKLGSGKFPLVIHHGSCIGADEEVHQIGFTMGLIRAVHPPTDEKLMAPCRGEHRYEPKDYLERNKDIVNEATLVIACPAQREEQGRGSGTWSTIRYAQDKHKILLGIFPDGSFDWL